MFVDSNLAWMKCLITHPFLFASQFKIHIFSGIITMYIPDKDNILSCKFLIKPNSKFFNEKFYFKNNFIRNFYCLPQPITNASYLQE